MPVVTIKLWAGQSTENKRRMAAEVTKVLSPFMNDRPEAITIIFDEVPLDSWARGGQLTIDRPDIQAKLQAGLPPSGPVD